MDADGALIANRHFLFLFFLFFFLIVISNSIALFVTIMGTLGNTIMWYHI